MKAFIHSGHPRAAVLEFSDLLRKRLADGGVDVVDEASSSDVVLAVGGDGTMLGAVQLALSADVPVLGFNLGTLGFLTEAEPADVDHVVHLLASGDYGVEERMTIGAATADDRADGVNDVVVEKVDSTRLITLEVSINGDLFATYSADGLIVATPTGSTGYAFSAGGPIVDPSLSALILTPVATHSLFDRPIVLPADDEIEITVVRDRPVRVYVDKTDLGQMGLEDKVTVTMGRKPARFVTFGDRKYAATVREKFGLD